MRKIISIGLVRYADHFKPTNELSENRLHDLVKLYSTRAGVVAIPEINPRTKTFWKATAKKLGFELHFFENARGER